MKKTLLACSILLSIVYCSCREPKTADEELASEIGSSKTFKNYIQYNVHLAEGIKSNRYNKAGLDKEYIKSQGADHLQYLPKKDLYAIYTTAKMKDAKDYINTLLAIDSTNKQLLVEFPALKKMKSVDRFNFLSRVRRQTM